MSSSSDFQRATNILQRAQQNPIDRMSSLIQSLGRKSKDIMTSKEILASIASQFHHAAIQCKSMDDIYVSLNELRKTINDVIQIIEEDIL